MNDTGIFPRIRHYLVLALALPLVLACALGPAPASDPATLRPASGGDEAPLVVWLPQESHPGGDQYDSRLDKPVRFWRAGLSLAEVFAGVADQTGVDMQFWPLGDENERVRVNLYLNPDQPPSLRELMAQLSWVVACAFAYRSAPEGAEPPTYHLLSTSIAGGAESRLEEDRAATMAAFQQQWESRLPGRQAIADRLAEYEMALGLSRDELIARYRGADDRLLVTMLDPGRRAAVGFALGVESDVRERLLDGGEVTLEWDDLTSEQQELLSTAFEQSPLMRRGRGGRRGPRAGGFSPADIGQVRIAGLNRGGLRLIGETETVDADRPQMVSGAFAAQFLMPAAEGELMPDEVVSLRRALGETVSEDDARSLSREQGRARMEEMRARGEQRTREAMEASLAGRRPLSPEAEARLSSFTLPIGRGTPYTLWQIQEAVATASGMHVVSDCFYQPPQSLERGLELLYPDREPEMTGLLALQISCLSPEDPGMLIWGVPGDHRAGWEWHDAGEFLRFRSASRDLWRASMVPQVVLARIDSQVAPYLETAVASNGSESTVEVQMDLEEISAIAAALGNLQVEHGWRMTYGDPAEKASAYQQSLRSTLLMVVAGEADVLRVLGTFSGSQWQQLRESSINAGRDLTPGQRSALGFSEATPESGAPGGPRPAAGGSGPAGRPGMGGMGRGGPRSGRRGDPSDTVIRLLGERPPDARPGRGGPGRFRRGRAQESYYLEFRAGEEIADVYQIPRALRVTLTTPSPILLPGGASED